MGPTSSRKVGSTETNESSISMYHQPVYDRLHQDSYHKKHREIVQDAFGKQEALKQCSFVPNSCARNS